MRKFLLLVFISCSIGQHSFAQETFPRNDVRNELAKAYAFTNGTVVVDYKTQINNATLLIRDGKIENVGSGITLPKGYIVIDLKGNYLYPSLIDPYTTYGMPEPTSNGGFSWSSAEQIQSKKEGAYNGNEAIKSEFEASSNFSIDSKKAEQLRENGFGAVLSLYEDGLARGTSTLVSLGESTDNEVMLLEKAAAHYSFTKGSSKQNYPVSTMGFIALLRQTYLDARWYGSQKTPPFKDLSLDAWNSTQALPQIFDTNGWLEILRADKLGDEFGIQYIIKGGGNEYQRIEDVKATNAKLIIPVSYPDAYDVEDAYTSKEVSLEKMKHWELAPTNPGVLEKNGIEFAFTAKGLSSASELIPNVRKAIEYGLSEQAALKALTLTPASLIRANDILGSLEKGKIANFIITSKPIFDEKMNILENWIQGNRYVLKPLYSEDYAGKYELIVGDEKLTMEIEGEPGSQSAKLIINDSTIISVKTKFAENIVTLSYQPHEQDGKVLLTGWVSKGVFSGKGQLVNGTEINWSATRVGDLDKKKEDEKKEEKEEEKSELGELIYPMVAHGNISQPKQETVLIKNATLWTNESEGIIENSDILLKNGKIAQIGKNLSIADARVIEANGMHVTSGIIDEHSHIAATSINDAATNSGMVRIGDVIDPTDVKIYTSLSGGVTALQILHGSANPIGGQSALIKLRWGASPENMKIKNADGFIKFALGENVKRGGNENSIRFPQTRMGAEQVYVDAFSNALEYKNEWKRYDALSGKLKATTVAPRRDLALEVMNEILDGKRFISCHSYVQSEINMLMNVADQFNFRINTFTHILEGYKVADKMVDHGVGGSTFSDWWAYKWEVRYAIPYNATIMHNAGVTVAINSDNAEMGRRLNQEAAKSIKYGGMNPEDAWKMVTLNPAKLLHLDDRMGSLKVGKDADVVIWTDNPLSVYAKVSSTFVDGIEYYNAENDAIKNEWIAKERARLIQKMNDAKNGGSKTQKVSGRVHETFDCDALTVDLNTLND